MRNRRQRCDQAIYSWFQGMYRHVRVSTPDRVTCTADIRECCSQQLIVVWIFAGNDSVHVQRVHQIGQIVCIWYPTNLSRSVRSRSTCATCQRHRRIECIEGSWRKWAHRYIARGIGWWPQSDIVKWGIAQNGERSGRTHIGGDYVSHLHGSWDRHKLLALWTHYIVQCMRRKVSISHFLLFFQCERWHRIQLNFNRFHCFYRIHRCETCPLCRSKITCVNKIYLPTELRTTALTIFGGGAQLPSVTSSVVASGVATPCK